MFHGGLKQSSGFKTRFDWQPLTPKYAVVILILHHVTQQNEGSRVFYQCWWDFLSFLIPLRTSQGQNIVTFFSSDLYYWRWHCDRGSDVAFVCIVHLIYFEPAVPQAKLPGATLKIYSALICRGGFSVLCVFNFILVAVCCFFSCLNKLNNLMWNQITSRHQNKPNHPLESRSIAGHQAGLDWDHFFLHVQAFSRSPWGRGYLFIFHYKITPFYFHNYVDAK